MGSLLRSFSSSSSASSGSKKQGGGGGGGGGGGVGDGDVGDDGGGGDGCGSELFLNVYDLTPINNYAYWFGFGIFHSGIEVHGMEYGFGAHEYPTSGVFEVEPRSCPGFIYRRSIWLGTTKMSHPEFRDFIEHLSGKYHGNSYHLIAKNCNHFTNDVCVHLTGKPIPGWVNRLARVGSFCNCLLPESIQVTAVTVPDHATLSGCTRSGDKPVHHCFSHISHDGSESVVSDAGESDEEDMDHHLLKSSNTKFPRAKHMTLETAMELS